MNNDDIYDVLNHFNQRRHFRPFRQVTLFKTEHTDQQGVTRGVTIEVSDYGLSGPPETRYGASARRDDGEVLGGNRDRSPKLAIGQIHLEDWDK